MSIIKSKLKSFFSLDKEPIYKSYEPSYLKVVAMKSRIIFQKCLEDSYRTLKAEEDSLIEVVNKCQERVLHQSKFSNGMGQLSEHKKVFRQFGRQIVQAESLKIYIELLRKIEHFSGEIIRTEGDLAHLKKEVNWFRAVLWYRKSRQITKLEEIYDFCYNFFKGIDITSEINVNCELFEIYPTLKFDFMMKNQDSPLQMQMLWPFMLNYNKNWFNAIPKQIVQALIFKSEFQPQPAMVHFQKEPLIEPGDSNIQQKVVKKQESEQIQKETKKTQNINSEQQNPKNVQPQQKLSRLFSLNKPIPPKEANAIAQADQEEKIDPDEQIQKELIQEPKKQKMSLNSMFRSNIPQRVGSQQVETNEEIEEQATQVQSRGQNQELAQLDEEIMKQLDKWQNTQQQNQQTEQKVELAEPEKEKSSLMEELFAKLKKQDQQTYETGPEPQVDQLKQNTSETFNDEQQSIDIMRKWTQEKPKTIKKPYMVSIYARAEYMAKK